MQKTLRRLHAQSPGATVLLVCTRSESPPQDTPLAQHEQRVKELVEEVERAAMATVKDLNQETKKVEGRLLKKRAALAVKAEVPALLATAALPALCY